MGFSTVCLLSLLDATMFTPNTTSVILAHERNSVQRLFKIIRFAYDNFPKEFPKPAAAYDNKNELFFKEINSTIYVSLEVRGDTVNNLHVSELAFMPEAENRLIASMAAVPPNGRITIESTAHGVGNYFYDLFTEAEERGFNAHFYPWFWAEEYQHDIKGAEFTKEDLLYGKKHGLSQRQLSWYKHTKALLKDYFPQEYPATAMEAFVASGLGVFPLEELDAMEPKAPIMQSQNTFMWEKPKYGSQYVMGIDVSQGIGKDESSIDVLKGNGEQVYHWSGQCSVPMLAEKVEETAKMYNNAFLVPEANNHGYSLIHILLDKGLQMYQREKLDERGGKKTTKLGWLTTGRTKPVMINAIVAALHEKDIQINHKKTLAQMRTYVFTEENSQGMGAATGKKDDTVISLALAWQGLRLKGGGPTTSNRQDAKPFDTIEFGSNNLTGFDSPY